MTTETDNILKKLPAKTPLWAVGVVSIIVAAAVSAGMLYTIGRGEVKDYMQNAFVVSGKRADADNTACTAVLGLVQSNAQQITELLQQNGKLSERVQLLERDLIETKKSLEDCRKQAN